MHLYVQREMLNFVTAKVSHPKRYIVPVAFICTKCNNLSLCRESELWSWSSKFVPAACIYIVLLLCMCVCESNKISPRSARIQNLGRKWPTAVKLCNKNIAHISTATANKYFTTKRHACVTPPHHHVEFSLFMGEKGDTTHTNQCWIGLCRRKLK